jgi:hypothetical protein
MAVTQRLVNEISNMNYIRRKELGDTKKLLVITPGVLFC